MRTITITAAANRAIALHTANQGNALDGRDNGDGTFDVVLDDDVIAALDALGPDTGDEVHDYSEAIIRAASPRQ